MFENKTIDTCPIFYDQNNFCGRTSKITSKGKYETREKDHLYIEREFAKKIKRLRVLEPFRKRLHELKDGNPDRWDDPCARRKGEPFGHRSDRQSDNHIYEVVLVKKALQCYPELLGCKEEIKINQRIHNFADVVLNTNGLNKGCLDDVVDLAIKQYKKDKLIDFKDYNDINFSPIIL